MAAALTIDVAFDLICPWCWIGKRHLAQALALWAQTQARQPVQVRWHSVQLLPQLPAEGVPFEAFYLQRLGSPQAVQARQAQVLEAAAGAGLGIDFPAIRVMPNTARAHHLLAQVLRDGTTTQHEALVERLFQAHFAQGRNIGDATTLVELAQSCGVNRTLAVHATAHEHPIPPPPGMGASGVPHFVFNHRWSLSGAQPPQVLLDAMRQALAQSSTPSDALVP